MRSFFASVSSLLLLCAAGCFAVGGCAVDADGSDDEDEDENVASDDGDGVQTEELVGEHQLTGSELPNKTIALTFDDGPGPRTEELATFLASKGIKATFFINGKNAAGRDKALEAVIANHHILGNHTQNHLQLTKLSADKVVSEVKATDDVIKKYQPDGPWLIRAPFGAWNGSTARAINATAMKKYTGSIFWNEGGVLTDHAAADWDCWGKGVSVKRCGELYLEEMRKNGKGISLMHDIHGKTIDMVKTVIVPTLIAEGWKFATLPEVPAIQRAMSGDPGPSTSDACHSATLGRVVPENTCVQARSDSKWYRCIDGDWNLTNSSDTKCIGKFPLN